MSSALSSLSPAVLKCYSDPQCTKELDKDKSIYNMTLGTKEGFNGTDGDYMSQDIYIKNCGDTNATETYIKETGDNKNYFKISVRDILLADTIAEIGTIFPNEVVKVKLSSYIPSNSTAIEDFINYTIIYNSVPPFNDAYYSGLQDPNRISLKYSKTTGNKIQEEYTISNIDALNRKEIKLDVVPIEAKTPIKIYHGTKDEILWDQAQNKYKVRLLCPNCKSWTSWYDLNTFDYSTELTCGKCSHKIKVASTVDFSENVESIEKLNKYKLPIKITDWTEEPSGTFILALDKSDKIVSINAYRKQASTHIKVLVNIVLKDGKMLLETLSPFEGYLLVLEEATIPAEAFKSKTGMAYGKYIYGKPLYGQESFIHIKDLLEVDIPIKGQDSVMISGTFKILTKYTGDEANIEDIQSYYTDRYMRLGCYDGPALPLKLTI